MENQDELDWENSDDFFELLANLGSELELRTQTEALLVERMAEHLWLSQRAFRLQDMCLHRDVTYCDQPKEMALYLRYQTTDDRAFHRCLSDPLKLRAQKRKAHAGFVSQQRGRAAEPRKEELHNLRLQAAKSLRNHQTSPAAPHPEPIFPVIAPQNAPEIDGSSFGEPANVA